MGNRLINILIDFAFKKVFAGSGEESRHILKDFLNSILDLKGENRIKEIIYLNPFNDRENESDKQSIMDIKVKTEKNEPIDIEVQINDVDNYRKRSLYYWSKLYGETIKKGQNYFELKKSIVINIVDFNIIEENDEYHNVFVIKERENNTLFLDDLEIHYIELKKYRENKNIDELNDLEEWVTFLKECNEDYDSEIIEKLASKKEEIGVAVELMKELSASELEYQRYLAREKYLMDERSKKGYAEYKMRLIKEEAAERVQRAKEEAQIEIRIAKEEAEEEKRKAEEEKRKAEEEKRKAAEAKEEAKRQLENTKEQLARNLLDVLEDEIISLKTGLTVEHIKNLRQNK